MFICTGKWHCTPNRLLSMVASFAMLPVNMQIIYATSLWKRRLWSNGFLSERLQNYKCKVILVRCHKSVFWNSLIPTNMPALATAFQYPTIAIYQRRPLDSIPRDSSFNVKAELSTVGTHWAGAPQEGQQIATHRNQDHHAVKIQAESRGSGKGQGGLEQKRKKRLRLYLSIQQVRTGPVYFSRMSKWTLRSDFLPLSVTLSQQPAYQVSLSAKERQWAELTY